MTRTVFAPACLAAVLLLATPARPGTTNGSNPPSPAEDGTLPALTAVAGAGTMQAHTYQYLEQLSDDIGARVTGSPADAQACEWSLRTMKSMGLENVHKEAYQIARGWTRGTSDLEIVAPIRRRLTSASLGWVGSTPAGGLEAELVPVNLFNLDDEIQNNRSLWRGKILIIVARGPKTPHPGSEFARFGPFLKEAQKAGAVAVIAGQAGKSLLACNSPTPGRSA